MDRYSLPVFQLIGDSLKNAMDRFLMPTADSIISGFQITLVLGITIYLILDGFSIALGMSDRPFTTFFKRCAKLICIAALVTSADSYKAYVVDAFMGLEEGLTQLVTQGPATDIYAMLDEKLAHGINIGNQCFDNVSTLGILNILDVETRGWMCLGFASIGGIGSVALIAGSVLVVAKTWMAILLAVGPLFIACLMFPITSKLFDGWLSQILNTIITVVLMAVVMTFSVAILDAFINQVDPTHWAADRNPFFSGLQIIFAGLVLAFVLLQVPRYASALAGGVAMGLIGLRQMASVVTAPARVATSAGRIAAALPASRPKAGGTITGRVGKPDMAYNRHLMESIRKQSA